MKVRLLKDLPTCQKGNIAELNGSVFTFNANTRSPLHFHKDEIEMMTEWFEIIKDRPVWANEQWTATYNEPYRNSISVFFNNGSGINLHNEVTERVIFSGVRQKERAQLISKAPDFYRFIKKVAETSSRFRTEAKELLNSIENA